MGKIWMASIVVAITLAAGVAQAQTPPPPAPGGAFESLSPGNQKIALAIFDSNQRMAASTPTKQLSLDQIAAMKQSGSPSGKGWGAIYKDMNSQGLVQDKNLGQAVSQGARGGSSASRTEITTGSGKTVMVGSHDRSGATLSSGPRKGGSDDVRGNAGTSGAVGNGRSGGSGASATHGGGGGNGGGRGK